MKINAGVWLDMREAFLIILNSHTEILRIKSDVDEVNPRGGYGASKKFLPQDAISESKLTDRKRIQLKKFFKEIVNSLPEIEKLVILGPGQAKKMFRKEIVENKLMDYGSLELISADKMTINQLRALVKEKFEKG